MTASTRTAWRTWCAPTPTSSARLAGDSDDRRGRQGGGPRPPEADLGADPAPAAAAASALREYFPAALEASPGDLDAPDALELLGKAPDPASAARLTVTQITAALKRAGRRGGLDEQARDIQAALRAPHLAPARRHHRGLRRLGAGRCGGDRGPERAGQDHGSQGERAFSPSPGCRDLPVPARHRGHPGARVLGEFGDAPGRYASAKARKNYAGTSPLTIQSGKKKTVHARYIRNRHAHRRAARPGALRPQRIPRRPRLLRRAPGALAPVTTTRCAASPAAWPASCTDALRPAANTTKPPHGPTAPSSRRPHDHDPITQAGHQSRPAPAPAGRQRQPALTKTTADLACTARFDNLNPGVSDQRERILAAVIADITRKKHLNPERRHRTYPRVVKQARHNSYRVKRPADHGTRHPGPATISLVSHRQLTPAA